MKTPIMIVMLAVLLIGCVDSETKIRTELEKANYCDSKQDCVLIGSICPFGCYIYVNTQESEQMKTMLDSFQSSCIYSCMVCADVACVDNKCVEVCGRVAD